MPFKTVKKPGYMWRAVVAWVILNVILIATMAAVSLFLPMELVKTWYIGGAIAIGIIASEWVIMAETIAPIIKQWINQEDTIQI